jgi:class 3 adenylate cyclase
MVMGSQEENDTSRALDKVNAIILFIDLVDSSKYKIQYKDDPTKWIGGMKSFAQYFTDVIKTYGGITVKYIGDEVMAAFIIDDKEKEKIVIGQVVGFLASLTRYEQQLTEIFGEQKRIKIAVDFGEVYQVEYQSSISEADQDTILDFLGTPVDRCARIAKFATPSTILASVYFTEISDSLTWINLGVPELKGIGYEPVFQYMPQDNADIVILGFQKLVDEDGEEITINQFFKKTICEFQGDYIQYLLQVAEKHKQLRQILEDYELIKREKLSSELKLAKSISEQEKEKVHESFISLNTFLAEGLSGIFEETCSLLSTYFKSRKSNQPTISIKVVSVDSENSLIPIFRNGSWVDYEHDFELEENSGFLHVKDTLSHYLLNNIPKKAQNNINKDGHDKYEYENPRFNPDEVKKYDLKRLYVQDGKTDHDWCNCWIDVNKNHPNSSYYKAVLLVPMTIHNNEIIDELLTITRLNTDDIYGLLSIEHHDADYFVEDNDISAAYIFADLLSLYILTFNNYTINSKVYSITKELLKI